MCSPRQKTDFKSRLRTERGGKRVAKAETPRAVRRGSNAGTEAEEKRGYRDSFAACSLIVALLTKRRQGTWCLWFLLNICVVGLFTPRIADINRGMISTRVYRPTILVRSSGVQGQMEGKFLLELGRRGLRQMLD